MSAIDALALVSTVLVIGTVGAIDLCQQWFANDDVVLPLTPELGVLVGLLAIGGPVTFVVAALYRLVRRRAASRKSSTAVTAPHTRNPSGTRTTRL